MLIIMLGMAKMKVKVYFYHLFILTVVMLLCFYLMYRDMKRIENNMVNLYQRCNNLDRLLNTADVPTNNTPNNNVDTELNEIYDKIENNMDNVNGDGDAVDDNDDNDEGLDDDGNENEDNNVENENSETEDSENDNNENDSEDDDNDVKELLHKVILVDDNNDDNNDDDDNDDNDNDNTLNVKTVKEINTELTDDVTDLLNSIGNLKVDVDFSKLSKGELLTKTKNELKEYLKSREKSTSGNKEQLVENILNLN